MVSCTRCRQQKIRCRGGFPCDQCNKKRLECVVDDRLRKILVTKRQATVFVSDKYPLTLSSRLSELEAKVALYEGGTNTDQASRIDVGPSELCGHSNSAVQLEGIESPPSRHNAASDYINQDVTDVDFDVDSPGPPPVGDQTAQEVSLSNVTAETLEDTNPSPTRQSSPESELMNPLALGVSAYTPNARSVPSQYQVLKMPMSCR